MKNATRPQYHRLRRVLEMLREGTRTGRLPNCTDFARDLAVSRRTLMRDLDFLRDDERAPIVYDERRKGFQLSDPAFVLAPVRLSQREVFSFSIARRLLEQFEGTPLAMEMRSVLNKVAESLEGVVALDVESLTDHLSVLAEDYARVDPEVWRIAARAINQRQKVRVRYQRFDGVIGNYLLEPYHLVAYHGNWYLLASNQAARRMETFALSRCQRLELAQEYFERSAGFDARKFFKHAFGISQAQKPWKVHLLFSKEVATFIQERIWHHSQKIRRRRDGSLEMRLETSSRKELTRWILSWVPQVKVLAPHELRERLRERMQQGLTCFR